jgi:hypothetical protein
MAVEVKPFYAKRPDLYPRVLGDDKFLKYPCSIIHYYFERHQNIGVVSAPTWRTKVG